MGVPKRKTSKARRDKRRAHHALATPALSRCGQCNEVGLAHHVCPSCGYYKGRLVLELKEE
ncbi:MAG: 50S ribosomal protein L32 [Syntrophobacteraceae bacterium]|nr:50S ribosomal protein L32 [Syntrophobacteraceae bacterium]